ncbi:hypothetical protein NQZ68_007771, partial [Dissostichus eleginoides]
LGCVSEEDVHFTLPGVIGRFGEDPPLAEANDDRRDTENGLNLSPHMECEPMELALSGVLGEMDNSSVKTDLSCPPKTSRFNLSSHCPALIYVAYVEAFGGPRRAADIWAGWAIRAKIEQKANTWQGRCHPTAEDAARSVSSTSFLAPSLMGSQGEYPAKRYTVEERQYVPRWTQSQDDDMGSILNPEATKILLSFVADCSFAVSFLRRSSSTVELLCLPG